MVMKWSSLQKFFFRKALSLDLLRHQKLLMPHQRVLQFTISQDTTQTNCKSMYESKNHILMGGGKDFFILESKGGQREDEINLLDMINNDGIYLDSKEAI